MAHSQCKTLAGSVRTAQSYSVAGGNLPIDVFEQQVVAEALGERRELEHARVKLPCCGRGFSECDRMVAEERRRHYSPSARPATANTFGTLTGLVR